MPVTATTYPARLLVALWRIDEDTARLASLCTGQENAWAGTLAPERRRREWLAWHAALHEEAPAEETFYRPSGAPALRSGRHIAVSHAGGYAALMLCDVPCGLDIERRTATSRRRRKGFSLRTSGSCWNPRRPVRRHRLVRQRSPLQMVGTRADSTGSAISASRRSIRSGKRSKERPEESASG